MLHAVIHNKKAREGGDAWNLEDNITSTFFGPMRFMNVDNSWSILSHIFNLERNLKADNIEFIFWPKFKPREPDMVIYFTKGSVPIKTILLEVKWEASHSGSEEDHQLKQQYDAYQKWYKRSHSQDEWQQEKERLTIIYLVLHGDKAKKELAEYNRPDHSVKIKTWHQVTHKLKGIECAGEYGLQLWCNDSFVYLSKILDNVFQGFSSSNLFKVPDLNMKPLFFSPFQGFSIPSTSASPTTFFSGEQNEYKYK